VPIRFVPVPCRRKRSGAWVVEDQLLPVVLPHELVAALHDCGQLDNMYDKQIAASFNYCLLGAAPTYLDAAELRPENVEAHESMIPEPKTTFPRSFLAEGRVVMAWLSDFVLGFRATLPSDARPERLDEMAKDKMGMAYVKLAGMAAAENERLWILRPKLHALRLQ
ncbi:unnamed protein product, partial [Symbiodinium microadriaticum]